MSRTRRRSGGRSLRSSRRRGIGSAGRRSSDASRRDPTAVSVERFDLVGHDGVEVPVENYATGMFRAGMLVGSHGAARDVSERERLERDLRRQASELAASAERAHLARELHDSVTQALFAMTLVSRGIELQLARDPAAALARFAELRELQREALAEMRSLIFELRPGSIERDGLEKALQTHVTAVEGRVGLAVVLEVELEERLPLEVEEAFYRSRRRSITSSAMRTRSKRWCGYGVGRAWPASRSPTMGVASTRRQSLPAISGSRAWSRAPSGSVGPPR